MKTLIGLAALVGATLASPAPAHADTQCADRVVAVGPTSCAFALNVADTGESYWMTCSIEHHGSTTCRGGDGAQVDIY
jgi:hypothetical protein